MVNDMAFWGASWVIVVTFLLVFFYGATRKGRE